MVDKRILNTLRLCLKIKKSDKVLIVTDRFKIGLAKKFEAAAKELSKSVTVLKTIPSGQHGREPDKKTAAEMQKHDVLICITRWSLTHTNARKNATRRGARIATLPNFTADMLPSLGVDYIRMERINNRIEKIMRNGERVEITTPYGTDLKFSIKDRKVIYSEKRGKDVFNIPLGEVAVAPRKANGVLVFNAHEDIIRKPTKIIIKNNKALSFDKTREGRIIKKIISIPRGRVVAEFGIGTNNKARHVWNTLQDEKVMGTCHIAFGSNITFGGRNKSNVHVDLMLFRPTIKIDNRIIMDKGKPRW